MISGPLRGWLREVSESTIAPVEGLPAVSTGPTVPSKGLKSGALGLLSSTVIALASTAPAYSLAATLGFIVLLVGVKAPFIMLLAFLPMYLIALAYKELNQAEPDCGTTFTWATRAFGPRTGWMGGWGIIAADVICMANLAGIAGSYTYLLFGADKLAASVLWSTVAGVVWIILMGYVCYRGIEISARLQAALLGIEMVFLALFAVYAIVKVYAGHAGAGALHPSLSWLWPSDLSVHNIVTATILTAFIYWGWDTAVTTNEEADDPGKTPGRAAVLSTVILVGIYLLVTFAVVAFAGVGTEGIGLSNEANASDVFNAMRAEVFGTGTIGVILQSLLIVTVLTSASASTQTTILPTARTVLSMGAAGAVPRRFARIHPRYLTPTWSTGGMIVASIAFYVAMSLISDNLLGDSIQAIGLMIAFYYGLTGITCVWYYRSHLRHGGKQMWTKGILPGLGGLMLIAMFFKAAYDYAKPDYGSTTLFGVGGVFIVGIGSLLVGAVLMVIYNLIAPEFFKGQTLEKQQAAPLEPAS